MRIHFLQHVPFEGPARIATWARGRGHALATTALFRGDPLPRVRDFDWLVAMGGPMGVHDEAEYPWLIAEKKLIERTLRAGKAVLGVCLGAQLLADVLGARVFRNRHKEIGWFPARRAPGAERSEIFRSLPGEFLVFHWHGDTFDLPAGALHGAESDGCWNQAFECGLAWGLQFHLEATPASVGALLQNCSAEIGSGPFEQSPAEMRRDPNRFLVLGPLLDNVLEGIEKAAAEATPRPEESGLSLRERRLA